MQDKLAERQFFDAYARRGEYDVFTRGSYRRLARLVDPIPGGWIGDLGCGTGSFTRHLAAFGCPVVAVDLSHDCLGRVLVQGVAAGVQADIEQLPFRDGSMATLVFSGVLHHLPDLGIAAHEAYRVLQPGGRGFAYDPHAGNPVMWMFRSRHAWRRSVKGRTINERNLTSRDVEPAFRAAGFANVQSRAMSGIFYRVVAGHGRIGMAVYNAFEWLLYASRLDRWFGSFLVTTFRR